MKMIKTLSITCFFILTMFLTGCLTAEDVTDAADTTTDSFSDESSFSWGGGSFGGDTLSDISNIFGQ